MKFALAIAIAVLSTIVNAQGACSETNDNGDVSCSVSCQVGQAAVCTHGVGSNPPTCECSGSPENLAKLKALGIKPKTFNFPMYLASSKLKATGPSASLVAPPGQTLEQTDVLVSINAKLATLPDQTLSESCSQVVTGRECHEIGPGCNMLASTSIVSRLGGGSCRATCKDVVQRRCSPVIGKFTAAPPFTLASPVNTDVSEPNWKDIPSAILGYRERYTNCTSIQQSINFRHTETTKVGTRVSKTKSLKLGSSIGVKIDFKFFDVGSSISVNFNREVTVSDVAEESQEETRSLEITVPLIVPPMTSLLMDHQWIRREVPIKFQGTVSLDAPLAPNLVGKTVISQVLPNITDRTFKFEGFVNSSYTAEGDTRVVETKLSQGICGSLTLTSKGESYGN